MAGIASGATAVMVLRSPAIRRERETPSEQLTKIMVVMGQRFSGYMQRVVSLPGVSNRWIEQAYHLQDRDEVLCFLEAYPFLVPLLLEAYDNIQAYFPDSSLSLAVVEEADDTSEPQLVLHIRTPDTPEEAFMALNELDEDWWLDALPFARGHMFINVRPQ